VSKDKLKDIRREYGDRVLKREDLLGDPLKLFEKWFSDALKTTNPDPTAMSLATVDSEGHPDVRMVLLKGIAQGKLVFYTNYQSTKAEQLQTNPNVALNFYWPELARQIRIRGSVEKISEVDSDAYFASRPIKAQLSAILSVQSHEISDQENLENKLNALIEEHGQEPVIRPRHWGGYRVIPREYEFWQGRDNRLHDRYRYLRVKGGWQIQRLAP
jgi:pyridoxamine 5'-phosphate oxidase